MNIVQMQEQLKDLSDQQLVTQLQGGSTPPYLILSEFERRKRVREGAIKDTVAPSSTVADDVLVQGLGALPGAQNASYAAQPAPGEMQAPQMQAPQMQAPQAPVQRFQEGGAVSSPAGRWFERFGSEGREQQRLIELQNALQEKYGPSAGLFGLFKRQTDEERRAAQTALERMKGLNAQQLQAVLEQGPSALPVTPAQPQTDAVPALMESAPPAAVAARGDTAAFLRDAMQISDPVERAAAIAALERSYPVSAADTSLIDTDGTAPPAPRVRPESSGFLPTALVAPGAPTGGLADLYKQFAPPDMPEMKAEARGKARGETEKAMKDAQESNLNMALMQAGFSMMAGTSPYAFENIGKGAMVGVQAYAEGKKDIRDLQKEIDKIDADAEDAFNKGQMDKYNALVKERELKLGLATKAYELAQTERLKMAEIGSEERIMGARIAQLGQSDERQVQAQRRAALVSITQLNSQLQRLFQNKNQAMMPEQKAEIDAQIADTRATMRSLADEFGIPLPSASGGVQAAPSFQELARQEQERRAQGNR